MKILIIEDEPAIARRTQRLSQAILGEQIQQIHICNSVESGLAYLAEQEIDFLLLDLNLHGADGFSILEQKVAAPFHTIIISYFLKMVARKFTIKILTNSVSYSLLILIAFTNHTSSTIRKSKNS